ncbi:MAG TPA: two-component regulator propeller domain-containing protein, partial [Kofleriaceae bacterium]
MPVWKWIPCVVGLWLVAAPVRAAPPDDKPQGHLPFVVFSGSAGLQNLVVLSLAQDSDGFLWLATEDGVYRYDGVDFTHFSVEEGLASTQVYVVGIAPDGRACAGGRAGLACWDGVQFVRVRGVPDVPVRTLASYAGRLWVGTDGAGLYVQGPGGGFAAAREWPGAPTNAVRAM